MIFQMKTIVLNVTKQWNNLTLVKALILIICINMDLQLI